MTDASYQVPCLQGNTFTDKNITVTVPGSKSITNRALLLAMLADGKSTLQGTLFSDDSRHFLSCLQSLGFDTQVSEETCQVTVNGLKGKLPVSEADLYVGSAGTAARFLSAILGVSEGTFFLDASEQMRRRPMAPLLQSLRELGCELSFQGEKDHFPFTLTGHGFGKDTISVNIDQSSQFLSALLIAAVLSPKDMTIRPEGSHGMAYIEMTVRMMEQFGVNVDQEGSILKIPSGQHYQALDYKIEPDLSAACYFYALAAILGTTVTVKGVHFDSLQGDVQFISLLTQMGCTAVDTPEGICLTGPAQGRLKGIDADLTSYSDQAITLAAIAPFADAPVTITGIGHIRHQESDRISAICENLTAMGISCEEGADFVRIHPGSPKPANIKTHDDHRLAMGFALTGLRAEGITISDPGCCRKTFENYFTVLEDTISALKTL